MTTTIHLGVHDISYADRGKTTGDIAQILENKYKLMEAYWWLREPVIIDKLTDSYGKAVEAILGGADPTRVNPAASAVSFIEKDFNQSLSGRLFDGWIPGVPTKAAEMGVSQRKKMPYAKYKYRGGKRTKVLRGSRPSFIDTGAFQSSFTVWVTST
jgi:hypothetical protein